MSPLRTSVVVCTYNRAQRLQRLLNCLSKQREFSFQGSNIIVVNNNCSDDTDDLVRRFQNVLPLSYLKEARQGKTFALNRAVSSTDTDLFLFTDDDVIVPENWIHEYQKSAMCKDAYGWFGGIIRPDEDAIPEWLHEETKPALSGYFGHYSISSGSRPYGRGDKLPLGASLAVRREVFDRIGLFREDLGPRGALRGTGDETEFLERAISAGISGYFVASNPCIHDVPIERLKLSAFYQYGVGKGINQYRLEGAESRSGSTKVIVNQLIRGLYQLLQRRQDRLRICILNIGIEMGRLREGRSNYGLP